MLSFEKFYSEEAAISHGEAQFNFFIFDFSTFLIRGPNDVPDVCLDPMDLGLLWQEVATFILVLRPTENVYISVLFNTTMKRKKEKSIC